MPLSRQDKPTVAIVSTPEDAHLPFVTKHLASEPLLIDTQNILEGDALTYTMRGGKLSVSYQHRPLKNVVGVWYRTTRKPAELQPPVSPEYLDYCRSAIWQHTTALYSYLEDAIWVSNPDAIHRAEYKPLQLSLAAKLGFRTPETIFTTDSDEAKAFVDSHPATITKSVATTYPVDHVNHKGYMFYAQKVQRGDAHDYSGLNLAPAIFQEAVDAAFDVRVTIIGDNVFAAKITNANVDVPLPVRDWRVGHISGDILMEPYELPADITDKCVTFVKKMGLHYGAMDLIVDKKDKIWFIENNPNGQWAFVEASTGQPIGKALAELLEHGNAK